MRRFLGVLVIVAVAVPGVWAGTEAAKPVHVMIANDDGVDAPGLAALAAAVAADPAYRVTVVAPTEQQSAMGHSLIIRDEVAVRRHRDVAGCPTWSVAATPATTSRAGITTILVDDRPDLVLSGINKGENTGRVAWYSGTVGAAREAALAGIPAMAISLQLDWENPQPDFVTAARLVKPIVDAVRLHGIPAGTYLNVNVPRDVDAVRGYRVTSMGLAEDQLNRFEVVREEGGVRYLRSRWYPPAGDGPGSDNQAVIDGWIAITPLALDNTNFSVVPALNPLSALPLPGARPAADGK